MANVYNEMTDACLRAAQQVMTHGSPELQAAMRVALFILSQDIARDMARDDTVAALLDRPDRALNDDGS